MKKILAIVVCVLMLAPCLAGCGFRLDSMQLVRAGARFDVNDSAELDMAGAKGIRISAVSDDIVVRSSGSKVLAELKGECRGTSKPVWLDARREGDEIVLEVKYPSIITDSNTILTVTIPPEYAGDLDADTVSGDIDAAELPFTLKQVALGSVSGGIAFGCKAYEGMKARTVSGDVAISGIGAGTDVHTTSGEICLSYVGFAETAVDTVSGGVEAIIAQDDAFSVDFDSVSGSFRSTHSAIAVDRADRSFKGTANGGGPLLRMSTTSGDLKISGK